MAEQTISLRRVALANVTNAPAGKVKFFVDDADGLLKYIDQVGTVRVAAPGVADQLLTADTPNPVVIDGTTPVAGQFLVADSPTQASWVDPGAVLPLVTIDSVTPATANFTAAFGKLYICDVSGGSFSVDLPAAAAPTLDLEIWFKLVGTNGANSLTLDPNAAETIDVSEATLVLTLDRAWAKLRSGGNGNFYQVG